MWALSKLEAAMFFGALLAMATAATGRRLASSLRKAAAGLSQRRLLLQSGGPMSQGRGDSAPERLIGSYRRWTEATALLCIESPRASERPPLGGLFVWGAVRRLLHSPCASA
jgi:hypothetical protein